MIGVFDSGVGGLSVLRRIREKSPKADIVYFGDIKNAPYGTRTPEELGKLTLRGIKILLQNGATNILSACNSISVFMLFNKSTEFKIMEMISPTVATFSKFKNEEMAIFATPATINSGIYQKKFLENGIRIKAFSIKELAGAIEFGVDENKIKNIIEETILKTKKDKLNKIILCCTHYPFVIDIFKKSLEKINKKVEIIDPSEAVAEKTLNNFKESEGNGVLKFLISQESEVFRAMVDKYFEKYSYTIEVV